MTTPKIDIIVTRHPHLITVLLERGLVADATPILTHVSDPAQVAGKHVVGVLPHHLSARAASITEIPMRWAESDREAMSKGDVGLDETRAAAGSAVTYVVERDRRPVAPPITSSNLTDLDDLAAAAYSVQATNGVLWSCLTGAQRSRWVMVTAYLLDICLPLHVHNTSPEMARVRIVMDGHGARRVAEAQLGLEVDHQLSLARIRAER